MKHYIIKTVQATFEENQLLVDFLNNQEDFFIYYVYVRKER